MDLLLFCMDCVCEIYVFNEKVPLHTQHLRRGLCYLYSLLLMRSTPISYYHLPFLLLRAYNSFQTLHNIPASALKISIPILILSFLLASIDISTQIIYTVLLASWSPFPCLNLLEKRNHTFITKPHLSLITPST